MSLKRLSQRLSPAGFVLALGLVISPESVSATVLESVQAKSHKTQSQELHQPTLLIKSAEEVSILTESNSNSDNNVSGKDLIVARTTSNTSSANNDLGKNNNVSITITPSVEERLKTSADSFTSAQNLAVADKKLDSGNQIQAPSLVAQSVSIPIAVENPQTSSDVGAVNIPVVPPATESFVKQQTESNSNNVITLEIEEPRFMSNANSNNSTSRQGGEPVNVVSSVPSQDTSQDNFQEDAQNPELVSVVPIQIEYYDPTMSPAIGDIGSPDLPRITSPDPFLPENQRPFNGYIWPAKGVFTSGYGWRWGRMHRGIDIAAPVGTPIFAAADGEVVFSGWNSGGYGNLVRIRHPDGSVTLYAHNSKLLVRRGQYVTQGQQIAKMGSTGFSTGPHLHFEIHPNGTKAVDPIAFLPRKR